MCILHAFCHVFAKYYRHIMTEYPYVNIIRKSTSFSQFSGCHRFQVCSSKRVLINACTCMRYAQRILGSVNYVHALAPHAVMRYALHYWLIMHSASLQNAPNKPMKFQVDDQKTCAIIRIANCQ